MNWFGKMLTRLSGTPPADSEFWYQPVSAPGGSFLAQYATGEAALRISTVSACVSLRSETIASLPCQVYRRTPTGRDIARDHPLYRIIHDSPNPDMSAFEFWQVCEQDLCIDGNFYARVETDARNDVSAMYPLDAACMTVARDDETGLIVYLYRENGKQTPYLRDEILHIPGRGYDGVTRLKGMSPVAYMRQSLDLAADAETYGARFFRNNAAPPAYIAHPKSLTPKTKDAILQYMMDKFGGARNAGKLGILEEGMEIKTVPINHRDMQYLEVRKFQIEEIARAYRVPLHMIGELDRSTNNNIEHQGIEWVTSTVRPECTRIERRLNMQLLGPREGGKFFIEFNLDALLRGDSAARATFYTGLRNIGVMNANEIRAKENLNPYEGGDVYMVQGAMIPVDMAGNFREAPETEEPETEKAETEKAVTQ